MSALEAVRGPMKEVEAMIARNRSVVLAAMLVALAPACAAVPPPQELVDARSSYQHAADGPAASLTPDRLHEAKVALDAAERAYLDNPSASRTVSLAYVAERRAELADVQARIKSAQLEMAQANGEAQAARAQGLADARGELAQTRGALATRNQQMAMTVQQLDGERKARAAAEARANEAMDKMAGAVGFIVKEETRGTVITAPATSLFSSGKSALLPNAQPKLDAVAEALKNQDGRTIAVEAHSDVQDPDASELSNQRARVLRDYLVSRGVSADSITANGLGSTRPVTDSKTPEGRARNRRVEIVVAAMPYP